MANAAPLRLTLSVHNSMSTVERDWRLLEADPRNSLHQGYDWCSAWVKTHGHPLAIVEGRIDGVLAFLLPLEIQRLHMVRCAQFIATRFTNFNSGIFSADFRAKAAALPSAEIAAEIAGALRAALSDRADLISLGNIPLEWRGERHPLADLATVENQNHAFQLPLGADMEQTIAPLNAKRRRKKYRVQIRKMESAGGFEHVQARSARDKAELLELFFVQKAARFKAFGLPNVFQAPETQAFFHLLLELDRGGSDVPLELHAIRLKGEHDGKIAAIAGLSRKGDHVICQFGSIDDTLVPEASPGELLFWLVIERSCRNGAALFDFGVGDQDYKRSWCTQETVHHDILMPLTSTGRLAALAQRGVTRTKAAIKGNAHLYGLLQRLRAQATTAPGKSADADD
ncbi:GNAT family N-acetyltransferase [Rhizobium sp. 18065]|uniref:GNAT family N-acetyltransferase n=1 Tax=Rhizobium sp. 18065 TaxID=2681411 RepID=UPI001FCED6B1|nr:GNAT family N-acetyltransferase [Rhizobium sp. 18065]